MSVPPDNIPPGGSPPVEDVPDASSPRPDAADIPSTFAAFRHPNFVLFVIARFFSILGAQMVSVAVAWQVYALTGRALDLGYVGLAQFLPASAFSFVAGYAADRFPRKRVLIVCQAALVLAVLLLRMTVHPEHGDVRVIYAILVFMGIARVFRDPAGQSLMPELLPLEHFNNAISWSSSVSQVARVVGPALGGILYGVSAGPTLVYDCALGLLGTTLLLYMLLRVLAVARETPALVLRNIVGGLAYVWKQKPLLGAISLDLVAVLFGGAVALLPIYCQDILHVGPTGLGMLRSAPALGAAVTAVALARFPLRRAAGAWMLGGVAVFGAATIAFGLSTSFVLSLILLVIMGASDMVSVNVRLTLEQLMTPPEMRGRVSAVNWLFINASNELGEFESGVTAAWFGAVPAVVLGGIATCVCVATWTYLFPSLRKLVRVDRPLA